MFVNNKTVGPTAATGGIFRSTTGNQSTFGIASTMMDAKPEGTTIPFEPVRGSDTMMKNGDAKGINTNLMCVTAMDKYKGRCLEELRVFDYAANRKGPQAGGSSFGQTNTGRGLFGPQQQSIFGSQTNAFGSTRSTPFGQTFEQATKPAFGSTATSSGDVFGPTPANTGTSNGFAFGSTGQSQIQTLFFGKPAGTNLFNPPAATSTFTGFGIGGFGTTTTSTSSGFEPVGGATTSTANNPFLAKTVDAGFNCYRVSTGGATESILSCKLKDEHEEIIGIKKELQREIAANKSKQQNKTQGFDKPWECLFSKKVEPQLESISGIVKQNKSILDNETIIMNKNDLQLLNWEMVLLLKMGIFLSNDNSEPYVENKNSEKKILIGFASHDNQFINETIEISEMFICRCPKECTKNDRQWICINCGGFFRVKNLLAVCDCGTVHIANLNFECFDSRHPKMFCLWKIKQELKEEVDNTTDEEAEKIDALTKSVNNLDVSK